MKVTAVFDIGKTNKKFFLFNDEFEEVHREYASFDLIEDEDGHPTEDLLALTVWVKNTFRNAFNDSRFHITLLNFSTYGASFVHIDADGEPLTPLYNYTKPYPQDISEQFFKKYGSEEAFTETTGSSNADMLNSGMQLYWLKKTKPDIYSKIRSSLHLPQYLSYLFTKIPTTEYTSIGCHTALWDFTKNDYHQWVYDEKVIDLFPPISETTRSVEIDYEEKKLSVGIGIHDSSAALFSYIKQNTEPFILLSTGTWNVTQNPFSSKPSERSADQKNTILYMQVDGTPVKSTRIFLGNEYNQQIKLLAAHYGVSEERHKVVHFNENFLNEISKNPLRYFRWEGIPNDGKVEATRYPYRSFEQAYHQLMFELVALQIENLNAAIGNSPVSNLCIDGGFVDNEVFVKLLKHQLPNLKLHVTSSTLGSALGAALCVYYYSYTQ
ncbi:MAG: sugar (pentulose or hexulose) kinase [Spirosomataceae bacterium]|jgi:sugar (pentulose or hexulose) kinase